MSPPAASSGSTDWSADTGVPPPTPFWQRIPQFFLLPLDRAALARILGVAAVVALSPLLLLLGPLGVVLMGLGLLVALLVGAQYGFTIIERSSQGFLRPADYPAIETESSWARPFKYLAVNLVFALLVGLVGAFTASEFLVWTAWALLFVIAVPAAVMRLVITGSLARAVSPPGLVDVVLRIGKPYVALCVFVFFADLCRTFGVRLLFGVGGVGAVVAGSLGGAGAGIGTGLVLTLFLVMAGFWYFTYMMCALIGYAMYQYADALEITVIGPGEAGGPAARRVDLRARARDALVAKMVAAGDVKEAIEVISDELRDRPQDLSLHARLHKLLLAEGYPPRIDDHTDRYLDLLMKTDNAREALPLVEEALDRNAQWEPRRLEHVAPLARAALAASRLPLAARLIRGFDRRHKGHPDVPAIYLIGAQLMVQQGGDASIAQARTILGHLVQRYPDDPAAAEGRRMLERLDRLAAQRRSSAR